MKRVKEEDEESEKVNWRRMVERFEWLVVTGTCEEPDFAGLAGLASVNRLA